MNLYYVVQKNEILEILSKQCLDCNVRDEVFYKEIPQYGDDAICIKIRMLKRDIEELLEIKNNKYFSMSNINLETRKFWIVVRNDKERDEIIKLIDLYKEIKYVESILIQIQNDSSSVIHQENEAAQITKMISTYEINKNVFFDRLKGFFVGMLYKNQLLSRYFIDNNPVYYNEYLNIIKLNARLEQQKLLDRQLKKNMNILIEDLQARCIKKVSKYDKSELILTLDDKKRIRINREIVCLNDIEQNLYEKMINYICYKCGNSNEKECIRKGILYFCDEVLKKTDNEVLQSECKLLLDRVEERNFDLGVEDFSSGILKNLFILYTKYDNLKELLFFVNSEKIPDSYISLSLYGLSKGYSNIPGFVTKYFENNYLANSILIDSISKYEKSLYSRYSNMNLTRYKIGYNINKITYIIDQYLGRSIEIDGYKIVFEKDNDNKVIRICNDEIGEMFIYIHKRAKNLASLIRFFDYRIKNIKRIYETFNYNDKVYFNYYFKSGKNRRIRTLQKEYLFSIVLTQLVIGCERGALNFE